MKPKPRDCNENCPGNIDPEYVPQRSQLEDANFALHCAYEEIDDLKSEIEIQVEQIRVLKSALRQIADYHGTTDEVWSNSMKAIAKGALADRP